MINQVMVSVLHRGVNSTRSFNIVIGQCNAGLRNVLLAILEILGRMIYTRREFFKDNYYSFDIRIS